MIVEHKHMCLYPSLFHNVLKCGVIGYSGVASWVKTKLYFALFRLADLYIRGTQNPFYKPLTSDPVDIDYEIHCSSIEYRITCLYPYVFLFFILDFIPVNMYNFVS